MPAQARDRMAGAILLAIALVWTGGVFWLIPDGAAGARLSPRAFPAAMGIALAVLSLLLIGGTMVRAQRGQAVAGTAVTARGEARIEMWALLATFGFLIAHLLLMIWLGFVVGTVLATAGFIWLALRQRAPLLLVGLPLGLAFGIWLVLGKLMGVYLPHGSLIDLF